MHCLTPAFLCSLSLALAASAAGKPNSKHIDVSNLGNWEFSESADKMTDQKWWSITTKDELSIVRYVDFNCDAEQKTPSAFFYVKDLSGRGDRPLVYRIDKHPAVVITARYDDNIVSIKDVDVGAFSEWVRTGHELLLRFTDYDDSPRESDVDINGAAPALEKLQSRCKAPH